VGCCYTHRSHGVTSTLPAPVVGQANPPQSAQQSAELEEALRLNQQAIQLLNQGQYTAAMPLQNAPWQSARG
jgi:hypothetical protein